MAERLADFHAGLLLELDSELEGSEDPEPLSDIHAERYRITTATPEQIVDRWQATGGAERDRVASMGREDREHAEAVTWAIVSMLATVQAEAA